MAEEKTKRLDLSDPQVWNKWRELYHELTHAENQQFGRDIEEQFPTQDHATYSNYEHLFNLHPNANVLEVGGWKGHLAKHCLAKYPSIRNWSNIEYCWAAADNSVVTDQRFHIYKPFNFHWFKNMQYPYEYDTFIAAHVIEHLVDEDLIHLMDYLKGIPIVMFEAPIDMVENDWTDYGGTHILKMGWNDINDLMNLRGYRVQEINPHCFLYTLR